MADARDRGECVLFDTDDLVFDPGLPQRPTVGVDEVRACRQTMKRCDGVVVSTEYLAERARAVNPRVGVVHNLVSLEMVEQAGATPRESSEEHVTLAYLSGTPTHDRDFLAAADAVLWALETWPQARLLTVGPLTLDERFAAYADRVQRLPLQRWRSLPALLASVDVNLAPLEPGSPFAESKSCVKYLEAALLGVPTVASPRSDFVRAIEHGANGLLAESREEWRESLGQLVDSPELRRALGSAARDDVRLHHTTGAAAGAVAATFSELARAATVSGRGP